MISKQLWSLVNAVIPRNMPSQLSLRDRLISGVFWSLLSAICTQGVTFLISIITANILGQNLFGKLGMIQSTIITFSGIAQLATGYTANKYVAEFRNTDKQKTGRLIGLFSVISIITGCAAGAILLAGAPFISSYLRDPSLTPSFIIAVPAVLFSVLNGYQLGVLAGLESYSQITKALVFTGLINLIVCSLGAWLFGLNGIVIAMAVNMFFQWSVFHHILKTESARHEITIRFNNIWNEGVVFYRFLLPAALSGFVSATALWVANIFLVRSAGGFNQMALYGAAYNIRILVLFLPTILNKVILSLLNNQKGLDDKNRYRKVFWVNTAITSGLVFFGAIIIAILGQWILAFFGKDFKVGYPVLLVMLLATIFEGIFQAFYQVIPAQEKMWVSFWALVIPRDGLIVIISFLLIPLYGVLGLAWAYAIAWSVAMSSIIILFFRVKHLLPRKL